MKKFRRNWYKFLQYQDYILGDWSCRAMKIRGYTDKPLQTKHLFDEQRS